MSPVSTINAVGHYCGRSGPGFWDEPLNSLTNIAFVVGALIAWRAWRRNAVRDQWQLLLFALTASVGVGSFIFHSVPTPTTLVIDLVPIQVLALSFIGYVALRYLRASATQTVLALVGFYLLRQLWLAIAPRGALGGGITHVPALVLLATLGGVLVHRKERLGRFVLLATVTYVGALTARTFDSIVCPELPMGLHWLWHLLTASTATLVVYGIAAAPPRYDRTA